MVTGASSAVGRKGRPPLEDLPIVSVSRSGLEGGIHVAPGADEEAVGGRPEGDPSVPQVAPLELLPRVDRRGPGFQRHIGVRNPRGNIQAIGLGLEGDETSAGVDHVTFPKFPRPTTGLGGGSLHPARR